MLSDHTAAIGRAYGFGTPLQEMIMVARGEQGRVWRLEADMGTFAIKELIIRQTPAERIGRLRLSRGSTRHWCGADAATCPHNRWPSHC